MGKHRIYRIPSCLVVIASFLCCSGPAYSATTKGCIPGVYLVEEAGGTQSLWSFSAGKTIHTTSSAQAALQFGDAYGSWKRAPHQQVRSTVLDFSYNQTPKGAGVPPAAIARVDAVSSFSKDCREIHGSFELRFFDPATEDPLEPATDTGAPISETFTGRRVSPL